MAESFQTDVALTHAAASLTSAAEAISKLGHSASKTHRAPIPRRGLKRTEASEYVGVSPTTFDLMVSDRKMPKPVRIGSRTVWDIQAVDVAFEVLVAEGGNNPWDGWST